MRLLAPALAALVLGPSLVALGPAAAPDLPWSAEGAPRAADVQHVGGTADVLVASGRDGAWRSTDDGATWGRLPGFPPVTRGRVAADPTEPAVLYVAGYGGVARTLDGGATWAHVLAADRAARLDVSLTGKVAVGARYGDGTNHVLVSGDRGATWAEVASPLPPHAPICGLAFAPHDHWLLTMTDEQSWYSRDGGASWTETPGAGFEIAIEEDGTVWRADALDGLERTTDGGATWQPVPLAGLPTALGPLAGGGVAVATGAGLHLTRDGGASWEARGFVAAALTAQGLAPDPARADAVFLTDARRGAARIGADANGAWWHRGLALGEPTPLVALAGHGPRLLAAGPVGLYASGDGGARWSHTGAAIAFAPVAVAESGSRIHVGGTEGQGRPVVESSRDGGRTFSEAVLPGPGTVVALAARGEAAWAAVRLPNDLGRLDATEDGGATWNERLVLPFALHDLAVRADGTLLLGTAAGTYLLEGEMLRPHGAGPGATSVASAGGTDVAASTALRSVWRGEPPLPLVPWAEAGPVQDLALGASVWAVGTDGLLRRCSAGLCAEATPPGGSVRAAWEVPGHVFAATASGLWQAVP